MKRVAILGVLVAVLAMTLVVVGGVWAAEKSKGEEITAKGELVDLWCYLDHGARGANHKECAVACVKAGNPAGLVTEKGEVYMLLGSDKHDPSKSISLDKMAEQVTVTGTLVKKGGVQGIFVKEMK